SSCKMAHGADSPPSRPLGLTSASSTSAALPSPQPPYLTSTPPLLLAPAASADSNGWCRSATEPPCNTPAVTPTSAIVRLPPPPPPAPPPPPLPPPGRSALRSSIGGGPRVLRKRVTIRETLLDDSASGSNSGSYSACRLVEIRRLSLTEPQPAHRMAPPGSSGADAADSAASSSSKEAPPRLMVDSKDDNDGDPTTSTAVPTTGVVVVVAPQADESCPELPAAPSVSPAGVAEPPVLVVNGDISLATTAMPTLPPPAAAAAAAIRTFASASTSPSPSSREEKQKERQRRREAQMWRRHQMELQLKQRGIAVSPCGRWIKHNLKCGEGAYKRVYRGYDREQGRPIAWCELKYQVGKDKPAERDQVRKENGERGEKVKATVIVTEFMSEGTLKEKMKTFYNEQTREAVVEFSVFQSWMQQILEGLRHMHHKMNPPVIHRDLKPENVFIADGENPDEYYNIKIGDFGLATAKTQSRKTMLGTLGYMAPEMLQERYDEKVDIFAFGLLMVELVTNCVPYQECQNFMDVWQRIASTTPPQVLNRLENPEIRDIFFTCTHPLPDFRPTSEELLSLQIFNLKPIPVQVQLVRLSQTVRWQDEDTVSPTQPTVAAAQQQISGTSSTARHRALSADVEYVGDPGRYYHVADFRLVVNDRALQQQMRILPGVGFEFQLDCFIDEDLENVVNSFADLAESDAPGLSADQLRRLRQKVVNSVRNQLLYYRKKVLAGIWNYFMDLIRDSEPEKDSELDTCIVRLGLQARRWAEAKRRVIKERDDYNGRWEEEAGGGGSGGQGQASPATAPSSAAVSRQVSQVDSQSQQQQQLADCLCEQPLNESPKAPADQNFGYFGVPGSPGYQPQVESLPAAMSASMSAIMNGQHHGNGLQYDFLASNSFISSSSVNATVTATVTSSLVAPVSADLPSSPLLLSLDAGEAALSAPVSPAVRCRKESSGA
uniref:Protein kinase domain-containing protein n=1 Tax=Macrostomum lignano TaxID=282301 RepID=A0A1I8GJT5_9PLAT